MDRRQPLLGAYVIAVAVLAAWVVASPPEPNLVVYRYDTDIDVSLDPLDDAVRVDIAGVPTADLRDIDLWNGAIPGLVLTASRQVEVDNAGVTVVSADALLEAQGGDGHR
ncbi:hypothetical protein BH23ACT9_BH23ACT9_25560 [soil metagenome]